MLVGTGAFRIVIRHLIMWNADDAVQHWARSVPVSAPMHPLSEPCSLDENDSHSH